MYVPAETMAAWLPGPPTFAAPVSREAGLFESVLRAHRALDRQADRLTQEGAFGSLLEALARQQGRTDQPETGFSRGVKRARAYIDEKFASDFSLDDLAGFAGLSRFHLVRIFKRATGLTPVAYRNQRRIDAARRLLRRGLPIAEIALEVGFADQSHLTRQFQRLMGTSPARYRQQ
jgi:AraC-like DNA-binding protein